MECWKTRWQPRVTTALKSIEKESFLNLTAEFSDTMGFEIEPIWIDDKYEVSLSYVCHRGGYFKFNTCLYDKPYEFYDSYSQSDINSPSVIINDFILAPKGQGLGTKIIKRFIEELSKTNFQIIHLRAQDRSAANFWQRFGFVPLGDFTEHMPAMKLKLSPIRITPNPKVKINGK